MKFCRDCRHRIGSSRVYPRCAAGEPVLFGEREYPITGMLPTYKQPFAHNMRYHGEPCGPDAKLFEPHILWWRKVVNTLRGEP